MAESGKSQALHPSTKKREAQVEHRGKELPQVPQCLPPGLERSHRPNYSTVAKFLVKSVMITYCLLRR